MDYIQIRLIGLPHSIKGSTVRIAVEEYIIFINARLNDETQKSTYDHEVSHIDANDYDCMYSMSDLEVVRHAV